MSKIAIIGMSGLFPGSDTLEDFWENLIQAKDLTGLAKEADFGQDPAIFFQEGKGVVDKCYSLRGGYIRDFEFDPSGYALDPDYLRHQDKLYQWSLYVAREALAHSGYLKNETAKNNCGLVLGNLSFPTGSSHKLLSRIYSHTLEQSLRELLQDDEISIPGHVRTTPENEVLDHTVSEIVAKGLGLGKIHYALDAACATSLYAIKLACDELMTGKADMMLAGAVCGSDQLFIHMGFSIFHAYAPMDKKFVPLDKDSAGLVSAEGAGVVVLKRLADAERDGDQILGVIGGIGLSNDGRGKFLLSPNPKGQKLAFQRAYDFEEIFPQDTSYLECHATGTPLGDVTEMNSIADFFKEHDIQPILGSVKSNMGHLLTAAGMSGLLKVLLSMEKELIPPNINLSEAVEAYNGWLTKEQMILRPQDWQHPEKQAGINSFGFGGTNAHMVVQNYRSAKKTELKQSYKPIELKPMSIIGMDAHFGDCEGLDAFYDTIFLGKQHFRELPSHRWKGFEENTALLKAFGFEDGKAPKGAYIDEFEIDLLRYKIQPKEAETLEPQQALILKVADQALKDAGLAESQNVAVLIAMESELAIHHYLARWDVSWQLEKALVDSDLELTTEQKAQLEDSCRNVMYYREGSQTPSQHTSFVGNIMASRIAALWDFNGPAFTVSCGENSVIKALEVAQNLLSQGEVEAVVVGGVDFSGGLENVLLRNEQTPVNSSEQPSLSLNQNEQGWLIGEGAGAIVLQSADQVQDSSKVYAQIDHIGAVGNSSDFGYLELAATGFEEQDQAELQSLLQAKQNTPAALGSVKANIGHTFAASGIAALIKTALCLHHRFIPAVPNWQAPKQLAAFIDKNYYFPRESRPWVSNDQRKAAVNGIDGWQIQLSEIPKPQVKKPSDFFQQHVPAFIPLGGHDLAGLLQQLKALDVAIGSEESIQAIAYHFFQKQQEQNHPFCLVILGNNKSSLKREVQFFLKALPGAFRDQQVCKTPAGSYFTPKPLGKEGKLAFVYPGSGTAYPGIGKTLFQLFPNLHEHFGGMVDDFNAYVHGNKVFPQTLTKNPEAEKSLERDAIALMSVGVFYAAAYTHILRNYFKIEPEVAFGYSMGECSSMWYALGLWDPKHAHIFQNSPIFKNRFAGDLELLAEEWDVTTEEAQQRWASYSLLTPRAEVEKAVEPYDRIYITFINTEKEVVIAGDKDQCKAIIKQLDCNFIQLPFQNIIHNDFCKKEKAGLLEMHQFPLVSKPDITFYSSLTLTPLALDSKAIAENSTAVCYHQVDFPRLVRAVQEKAAARLYVELGAHATCTGWIRETLRNAPHLAVSMNQRGKQDAQSLVEVLAQLLSHRVDMDISYLYANYQEASSSRTFAKKIIPGGYRIHDLMFSETNQKIFSSIKKRQRVLALAGSETETVFHQEDPPPFTTKDKETRKMEITTINTPVKPTSQRRLGENGLILQDYESGEHLKGKEIIFSQEDLEEFANGSIAKVFGPEYAIIDTYRRRVMLPKHPYLLVSRVTGLKGQLHQYQPSFMQTEYDIPYNAWFTTDGQIPWAVSVESGQCDLLLISYLGIDFKNKGNLVYRLLDCTLTFVDDLPFEGQTLRYDISINSFVKNGDNLLFFFSYRCYVQDRLVLKMDGGCAGFFTDEQLEEGHGVVYSEEEIAKRKNAPKKRFTPLLRCPKTAFSKEDLRHLINNEPEKCFGDPSYYRDGRNPSLCLPPEKILMIDRITTVDVHGGAYGLGYIEAEKDLHPDDWFFPCHFRDDEVLAGSLQAEGGGNLLRFFMLHLGLQRLVKDARYQPVFDLPQKVRCRKQVTPKDTKLVYKLEIKEIGLAPNPYMIGDLEIISDGIVTVHFENLGLQLREKDNPKYLEETSGIAIAPRSEGALLNEADITTFALDDLSKCFGPDFAVYDGRTVSRQPNTDLQLISRVLKIDGERGNLKQPSTIYAEYDVPQDAWYYEQNSSPHLPYSILMEIALQPCGLLGAYLGSTLQFPDKNLYFRNLDGSGEMLDLPMGTDFRGKTISNKAVLASSVALGGTILQNYTFECSVDGQVFYKGKSSFGFFPEEALATQVGLDNGGEVAPWFQQQHLQPNQYQQTNLDSPYGKLKLFRPSPEQPQLHLSGQQLNFLDKLIIATDQGEHGKGYIYANRRVRTYDWFFTCHFYQDPVMPGSLGVEAILQAMQTYILQQGLAKDISNPRFEQLANHTTVWKYRGQILLDVKEMQLEVHIKSVEQQGGSLQVIGDAYLWRDGMRIYQITDIGLEVKEGGQK